MEKKNKKKVISSDTSDTSDILLLPEITKTTEDERKCLKRTEQTMARKKMFVEFYQRTLGSVKATCEKIGINRDTYYDWMNRDQDFKMQIKRCWRQKLEDVEQLANNEMLKGNASLIRHFLDRRHPDYMPKLKVMAPALGEKSLEEEFDEMEFVDDNNIYAKTKDEQLNGDQETISNSQQEGDNGAVSSEPGAVILLDKKNA